MTTCSAWPRHPEGPAPAQPEAWSSSPARRRSPTRSRALSSSSRCRWGRQLRQRAEAMAGTLLRFRPASPAGRERRQRPSTWPAPSHGVFVAVPVHAGKPPPNMRITLRRVNARTSRKMHCSGGVGCRRTVGRGGGPVQRRQRTQPRTQGDSRGKRSADRSASTMRKRGTTSWPSATLSGLPRHQLLGRAGHHECRRDRRRCPERSMP